MDLNFMISELCYSDTAKLLKISNIPTDLKIYDNLLNLIFYVLQPLRLKLGKPIIINSGYRSKILNTKVGGVSNSQHLTGQAADIHVNGMTNYKLFDYIKLSGIPYDQCILEHSTSGSWIHISYNKGHNRKQSFKL